MAVARQQHERAIAVAHFQMIGSLFSDKVTLDLGEYILRGAFNGSIQTPMPNVPGVDEAAAEIMANGGKLTVRE
jgi:hypothetical protein